MTGFERGLADIRAGRRTVLVGGAGIAISAAAGAAAVAAPQRTAKRAYVLVVDGCRPEELDLGITPNLTALRDGGLRFPKAWSGNVAETIPNHVMMMTGMRGNRTGVPANSIYDRALREVRTMDKPSDIKVGTVLGRMKQQGFTTGTVLSKEYLYGIFGTRATYRWEPAPIVPVSGHAPDQFTMDALLAMVEDHDPHLVFVNLGDVDRVGHSDLTGTTLREARHTALTTTDTQVGRFVSMLKQTGRWRNSMVLVLADHSMDWSRPDRVVSLQGPLDADPLLAGKVQIACNGGADLLYWTGPRADRDRAVARMQRIAEATEGVLYARPPATRLMRLGPEAGEVVAFCRAGWRFSDPEPASSNPIPGNHGHPASRSIPFFIGGGHPRVPKRRTTSRLARTFDVAPTVADFFGLAGVPRGGYDGRSRL